MLVPVFIPVRLYIARAVEHNTVVQYNACMYEYELAKKDVV